MTVTVNGEETEVPHGLSLLGLVESLGLDPRTVAIEYNGEIAVRASYGEQLLAEGDRLEVVRFVQGGSAL
jgi:thiamine biosynthesis protein ThiS